MPETAGAQAFPSFRRRPGGLLVSRRATARTRRRKIRHAGNAHLAGTCRISFSCAARMMHAIPGACRGRSTGQVDDPANDVDKQFFLSRERFFSSSVIVAATDTRANRTPLPIRARVGGAIFVVFRLSLGASRRRRRDGFPPHHPTVLIDQRPSLVLRSSLTACGFALPPDAFIT